MKISIKAKSSSGDPYSVDFIFREGRLFVFCNCPAGIWTKLCKHKRRLLSNDASMLFAPDLIEDLDRVQEWAEKTKFPQMLHDLREMEKEAERLKRKVKSMKEKVAKTMKVGAEVNAD